MSSQALTGLDYGIIAVYLLVSVGAGLVWTRSAGRSMTDFFLSGRSLPWWLAGVSMAATNFSIDTPLAVTGYVAKHGVAGVWFFWSSAISALLAAFLFARLWRRAAVVTDAELIEVRYSGRRAAALRLFKGIYFGVFLNCYVLGWVLKAVGKVMAGVSDLPVDLAVGACAGIALVYTVSSGLKGVVWTDFFQYGVGLAGSIVLAVLAVQHVGGIDALMDGLDTQFGSAAAATAMVPGAETGLAEAVGMPLSVFLVYVLVQWWAHKYADGGGKHIQRMLACRSEGHAQGATVLFAVLNYAVQVWPWIVTALCSLVVFGRLADPEMGYPRLMATLLPPGLLGLLVVSMLGAFMSTVDTHLNLGGAYIVNDLYRRFVRRDASERHYVRVSRVTMVVLLGVAFGVAASIESIGGAWKFLLSFASGAGLTWILRWFWWRLNAWSEISAMAASGIIATYLHVAHPELAYTTKLLLVVGCSTLVWLPVTLLTRPTADERLRAFVTQVRPGALGWRRVASDDATSGGAFLLNGLVDWALGVVCLFAFNFAVGDVLFGALADAVLPLLVLVASGAVLVVRLWRRRGPVAAPTSPSR